MVRKFGNPCSTNLDFCGTLGGCMGCFHVKSVYFFFIASKRKVDRVDVCPNVSFIQERDCDCGYRKRDKSW